MNYPDAVWDFIEENQAQDPNQLALKLAKQNNAAKEFILQQINGKQKAKEKFPFLLDLEKFLYPSKRAIEQASSEITARHKAQQIAGKRMADLSGGMGVDSFFFAQKFEAVYYLERKAELVGLAEQNAKLMGLESMICKQGNAEDFLKQTSEKFDWLYLDPDRRKKEKRFHRIEDCEPHVLDLLPNLLQLSENILIKLSPLIDLKDVLKQISQCEEIQVIGVKNECKEVLAFINKAHQGGARIKAIDLKGSVKINYSFKFEEEEASAVYFHEPLNYLYEPNASILKAGAFKKIAADFKLYKLAQHTHLYTSERLEKEFPGRIIKIDWWGNPQNGKCQSANVVKRNFPLSVAQIRKKYKIKESLKSYCYACTLNNDKRIFITGELIN